MVNQLMKLTLERRIHNPTNIIGKLSIDGVFYCYTLEDVERNKKIKHETCIPIGTYTVKLTPSNRFKKIMPLVFNNPVTWTVDDTDGDKWEGIRIHGGNTEANTSGCILVGKHTDNKKIWESMSDDLITKLTGQTSIQLTIK